MEVEGEWIDAVAPGDCAILTAGLMIEGLTIGSLPTGWHRVVAESEQSGARLSVVPFGHPTPHLPSTDPLVKADNPMHSHRRCAAHVALLLAILLGASRAVAAVAPIVLDGDFGDWQGLLPVAADASGDGPAFGIDFGRVWVANDHRHLFLRFETGREVQGDEQQSMRLYLDTDLDASTGVSYDGIGADLVWDFGLRSGSFRGTTVSHAQLGMLLAPTVSSTQFEIALRLDAEPVAGVPLFPGPRVRWILRDLASGGDRVPDTGAVTVEIEAASTIDPSLPLERAVPSHLRIANYNVLNDGLFAEGERQSAFTRLLGSVNADVWIFNEIWDHDAAATADRLEELLPAGGGRTWHAVKRDAGNVIVSRYPILESWVVLPGARLSAARLDLGSEFDHDLLVIAAHFSCCTADVNRQEQADALIAFVRDAQTPGGRIDLPHATPIVAGGDFNLVGWKRQLDTLLTGDIFDESTFGPDHAPDWDGSGFDLAPSTHNEQRVGYTWRNDGSSFLPGLLDFLFYTGSVVGLGNHYVLDTRTMRSSSLAANGLLATDTARASDHALRVTDLALATTTSAAPLQRGAVRVLAAHPNPFNPRTVIAYEIDESADVELEVLDLQGRHVRTLVRAWIPRGRHHAQWNGDDEHGRPVASGAYVVRLSSESGAHARKLLLVR